MSTVFLLYAEWQGSGKSPAVQEGALTIARELFPDVAFVTIDSPEEEVLERRSGVIGLASIAPRFLDAIARLRTDAPDRIVTVGGTCGVEAAPVGYLNERFEGDLAVVWLDAHGDLNTPATSPSGNFHGMVLRTLLGDGPRAYVEALRRPLQPQQVFLAATRDLDPPEAAYVKSVAMSVTAPPAFDAPGRLAKTIRARGFSHVYLHFDLDALNPQDFPDTLMRTPGGPSFAEVLTMIRTLAREFSVAGFSIVEYIHGSEQSLAKLRDLAEATGIC